MANLVPVDGDPFAPLPGEPKLVPVERDPFAPSAAPDWADVPAAAISNAGPSAKRFAGDIAHAVTHPWDTVSNIVNVGAGAIEKLSPVDIGHGHEKYADAFGKFFADRYGGMDNLKRTMADDPVGFLADVSTVLTGGAAAAARVPGTVGRIANAAGKVATAIDPIAMPINAAKAGSKLAGVGNVGTAALGVSTGAGRLPFKQAFAAGAEGGEAGKAFRENMRGTAAMTDVITDAKSALDVIKANRQAAYNAGMTGVKADTTILDFNKIDQAVNAGRNVGNFTGRNSGITVTTNPSAVKTMEEIDKVLDEWRQLPPDDFHTAAGFDALKKRLGDIMESTDFGSPANKVATRAYNAVKDEITKQAPEYAKTMAAYSEASDLIRNIEKTLSVNPKATVDTELRKLQSVMRDGVQTNYGQRADLVKMLQDAGAAHILTKLAGQALKEAAPLGLARAASKGVAGLNAGLFALSGFNPFVALSGLGSLAASSPRLMGEAVHGLGRASSALDSGLKAALRGGYAVRGMDQANPGTIRP